MERWAREAARASPEVGRAGGIAVAVALVVSSDGPSRALRVAVVDDDSDFLTLMEQVLTDEGYDVDLMRGFRDAHEHVRATHPDLVICDIVMKEEERGWELVELLTLDPQTAGIPLIVCSAAVVSLEERRQVLAEQGIRSIAKPFDLVTLVDVIKDALGSRSQPARM